MSEKYNPNKTRNLFKPDSENTFRMSRGKIDNFIECPRCFYMDRRLGVSRPPQIPFTLNTAVDALLKKEFDVHRAAGTPHPLMQEYGLDAVPFQDERMDEWRDSLRRGITVPVDGTNVVVTGGVDDVWKGSDGKLIIVDYKATSKNGEVNLDSEWQDAYKRQLEVYQWLFRKNGFDVSDTGYFVYANGDTDKEAFDGMLEFDIKLLPYEGSDSWVEPTIYKAIETLKSNTLPESSDNCDYCAYRKAAREIEP